MGKEWYHALDYRAEKTSFAGRTNEIQQLDNFLAREEAFLWWGVVGGGGSGKSRLALEFVKKKKEDWKMLFLPHEFFGILKFRAWEYSTNLLLVVDYVQSHSKEIATLCTSLFQSKSLKHKIRVLLLERDGSEEALWYRGNFSSPRLQACRHDDFLELFPLSKEDFDRVKEDYFSAHGYTGQVKTEEIVLQLEQIDSHERILYFIMMLDAIIAGEAWRNWSKHDLSKYIIDRELSMIKSRFTDCLGTKGEEAFGIFRKMLAYVTATREVDFYELKNPYLAELQQELVKIVETRSLGKTEITSLLLLQEDKLYPLLPDIIGEFFTLTVLNEYIHAKQEKKMFIQSAWKEEGLFFLSFLLRLAEDEMDSLKEFASLFSFDDSSGLLQRPDTDNLNILEIYSMALWGIRWKKTDKLTPTLMTDLLKLLYQEYPSVKTAESYARGLVNLSNRQEGEAQLGTVALLQELAASNPESVEIAESYARGLFNLSTVQQGEARLGTVVLLAELAVSNPQSVEVVVRYAKGLVNLSTEQEGGALLDTVALLEELADSNPESVEIMGAYARGLVNLSNRQEGEARLGTVALVEELAAKYDF